MGYQALAVESKLVFPELGTLGIETTWVATGRGGELLTVLPGGAVKV